MNSKTKKFKDRTDWTKYYQKKKSFFSTFTQKYSLEMINEFYQLTGYSFRPNEASKYSVIELEGGNSCFAAHFCKGKNLSAYDIVDNNELAVKLFELHELHTVPHKGFLTDLTKEITFSEQYDFVYSIGLIEHFSPKERSIVIKNHFKYCKENGHVLISFPTPTRKYRFWRKCMELARMWQFWDEVPLRYEDVKQDMEHYGDVLAVKLNRKLFLTQMLILIKKRAS